MNHPDKSQDDFDKSSMSDLYKVYPQTLPTNTISQQKLIPASLLNAYPWNSDNQGNYFSMCGSPVFPYLPNPLDSFGRMVSSVSTASNMLNYFLLQNAYSPQMTNFQPLSSAPPSQCYPAMSTPEESKGINMFPTQTASPTPPASFNSSSIYPYIMHPCLSQLDLSSTNYAASQGVDLRAKTSSGIVSNASVLDSRDAPLKKLNSTMSTDFSSSMNKSAFKTNREVPMGSNDLVGNFHPGDFSMCCSDSLSGNFEKSCKNECQDVCETTFKKKNSALLSNALNLTTDNVTKESSYEKVLYRNIISEMNMDILFDNELEEWLTKVTVKSLLYDTCSLLHQYSTSVYLDQTSSPRSNFNTYKYKFKKTSAELALIKYTVSSQWCAVCQEVARPMELALLGDLLVYCKDCGLAVHRRCYGVHRIFVDDQQDKHFLFLCCFCQNVRRLNKKKALKVRHSGKKEIGCAICSRHYDGTTEPEAFHPISNHDNIWVHTYCAFLSRNHVQIKDIQFVRTLEWIGPVEPYSVTKQDTQNILQKNYFTSLEKLQDFNTLSKKDTGFESHLQTKCEDPLNGENVTSEPSTVVHCMFCFKTSGVLLQCSTVNCSNFMHLYCLKRQIQCTEQDGKSSITTALTVTLGNPFTFTTSFILNISCLLHLVTPSYCLCRKPFTPSEQSMMVGCDVCGDWLHGSCIGSNEVTRAIQKEYYKCLRCENQSFYFQFLDLLWSTFPLEHADYAICRQFLNHLFLLESNSVHSSIISPFFKIIPSHTDPLPFTDILLLCFAWQWRIQALLLVDRVTLLPATTTSVPEKNNMVKKISLNKRIKLAGHRQEGKLSETNSCPVEYPIPSLKKKEMPLLVSFKTKNVNKGLHVQEKIKRKSEFKGTHTFPHYTGSTEKVKKNHKTNRMDMDGKKESKLLKSDSPCLKNSSVSNNDQEVLVENDLMDATWSGTSKDMCFFKSNVPLTPICSIRDLLRIQSLAQCLPIGVVFWVESLNDCIQRCQSWIDDVKECLKGSDVDQLDKLVNYFNAKTITAFLASTKGNISKVSEYSLPMPRTCYLNMISPYWAVNLKIKENIPSFIVGGLVLVTQEASHVRETAVIELFLKKYHSCVFETPTKGLDATIIKFIRAEILRVPELESLQKHPMFTTCQTLLNRIQECKTKAYQLKQNTRASLKEIQELLETVENEVPQNHQIDLYNFPEVVSKAKELEEQVDWSNLRSIRETLNQAQQLPVTSDVFDKLQILIQEVDSWRKEYHRFISLVKATPNHMLPTSEAEEKDETHNVVLSGRSGFLKNLFVSSTDPTKMIMDKYHETRHDADGSTPLYTQSQTFESALKLMEKKNKINVQCDEVTLLQEWISQCQKWIDDANCVLGALHNTPLNEGVQNSSIHDMPPGHFQKDHQKMSQGASWQLPQMETLLRRKAELPLAVPLHFADLLRERVHELQCIESKANKVALGNFSEGKEHEQFHTRNEAHSACFNLKNLL
ncbi:uncharacterized protein LOC128884463 [Hylaeus volcanicus]|uniref:uncharacterized protein LOC128884463 n=1 Tax=Hylaeus volcanicus TaxID=313075 RepID=UPI0023B7BF5E|nr:uncharacterized protein LOC128884463 [Hylaeus volcanicus]